MEMKKRAVFFTLLAIILVGLFIASFSFYVPYHESKKTDVIEVRINSMNQLLRSVNSDMQRALYISSFRAIFSLIQHITSEGTYLSDAEHDFKLMLLNGTIDPGAEVVFHMDNQTIINWTKKIMRLAEQVDLNLTIRVVNVTLSQSSPWTLNPTITMNISLTDKKKTASWQQLSTITASVPVDVFEEPVYAVMTNGSASMLIVRSNISVWNISALKKHLNQTTFIQFTGAPSFLQRLEGNIGYSSPYGIEALVNKTELERFADLPMTERSSVDYLYFGSAAHKNYSIHEITDQGFPDFRLDPEHIAFFNVGLYNYTG
ncbi:MAG: hypothetical protein V1837_06580 [Candidatus Woesearchaeota archaeon]